MILGDVCTRNCRYCRVTTGKPSPVDLDEPLRVADAAKELELSYVVVTSVCRDDLADGGASQYSRTVEALRNWRPHIPVEVLVPDFRDSQAALERVLQAKPTVLNHNVETVPRLYPQLRPQGKYHWALELLARAKALYPDTPAKSGLMLGLGEREDEVLAVLEDLRKSECDVITLGQYIRPSLSHWPVQEYLAPEKFNDLAVAAKGMGFRQVLAGPLVRSSFMAQYVSTDLLGIQQA